MLMTTTKAPSYMIQRFDLEAAAAILENEGLVLLPTDTLWSVACLADDPLAIERLKRIIPPNGQQPFEILFDSLEMLKAYVPNLHPKLETLLIYHTRPVSIFTESATNFKHPMVYQNNQIVIRIAQDKYCKSLINILGKPIVINAAYFPKSPCPNHFGKVRSDIISAVDYVAKYRVKQNNLHNAIERPTALIRLNGETELEFVRE